jgi:hypothetical protein
VDEGGFRVHDSFGRVARDVRWEQIKALGEVRGNAPFRPGGDRLVGFTLFDPPAPKHRLMSRPGIDGYLPDPYAGFEEAQEQLARYAS